MTTCLKLHYYNVTCPVKNFNRTKEKSLTDEELHGAGREVFFGFPEKKFANPTIPVYLKINYCKM